MVRHIGQCLIYRNIRLSKIRCKVSIYFVLNFRPKKTGLHSQETAVDSFAPYPGVGRGTHTWAGVTLTRRG